MSFMLDLVYTRLSAIWQPNSFFWRVMVIICKNAAMKLFKQTLHACVKTPFR